MAEVKVRDLVKAYGRHLAVRGIDLDIPDGAFVVLVGPSGCGKSTTLRMIAGLETISHGEFLIDGKRANDLPSRDRGVAMVFQTYALYPHLTVKETLAFSLKLAKVDPADMDRRINGAIAALELQPYLDRRPSELSGGQRQRVAMGRAIVREPDVFLFDEPLSNLDAKLRNQMRVEIKRLQHRLGVTTIYVTHDQIEAMTLADVIVVMKDGEIAQRGTPLEVFENPANKFVASFIGSPQINFFDGVIKQTDAGFAFVTPDMTIPLDGKKYGDALRDRQRVTGGLRPEDIIPHGHGMQPEGGISIMGEVTLTELLGNESLLFARCGSVDFVARMQQPRVVADGENLSFHIAGSRLHLFDEETETSLRMT